MLVVHHLDHSRSQRVLWLLEELGVPYELELHKRDPGTLRAPRTLASVHPLGRAPVVVDGDRVMAESGAVLEQLVDGYDTEDRLAPVRGTPARDRYVYFMHYAEGSAMLPLVLRLIFNQMPKQPMPALARPVVRALAKNVIDTFVQPQLDQQLDHMEASLAAGAWFTGDAFSAADIQMSFPVEVAAAGNGLGTRPRLAAWVQRIRERPAYQRAITRGGPYDLTRLG